MYDFEVAYGFSCFRNIFGGISTLDSLWEGTYDLFYESLQKNTYISENGIIIHRGHIVICHMNTDRKGECHFLSFIIVVAK